MSPTYQDQADYAESECRGRLARYLGVVRRSTPPLIVSAVSTVEPGTDAAFKACT